MADYNLEGEKWGASSALGTPGGVVTWAADSSVPTSFMAVIASAFADWSRHANIQFQEVSSTANASIDFSVGAIDGPSNVLGETSYAYLSTGLLTGARIEFDSGENWHAAGAKVVSASGSDLFIVALHEIGHSIGMDHYNSAPAVMNAYLNSSVADLTASDIDGITALYGGASVPVASAPLTVVTVAQAGGPDFNGDGKADVLWRNSDGHVSIWTSSGSSFTSKTIGSVSTDWHPAAIGDFSGDGKADLLWRNDNGAVSLWTSIGNDFQSTTLGTISADWHAEASLDASGDHKADILWRNDSGAVSLWKSTGTGFQSQAIGQVSLDWHVAGSGDITGDGKADVLWRNDSGEVSLWKSTGTSFQSQSVGTVSADWHIAAVADFTGDGRADVVWRNDSGAVSLWTSTASGFQSHDIGKLTSDWHVEASSDINGDGMVDLLLRNDSGAVSEWLSTGSNFTSHDVGQISSDWHLLA